MKSLFYLSVFLLIISTESQSQVDFENTLPWNQVLKKAQKEKKLIFLQLEDSKCSQCNEVASQGLSSSMMREKFSVNFVCLRVNTETPEGKEIAAKYELNGFPVSLFLDAEGNVLHRYNGSTSAAIIYMQHADVALSKRNEKPLSFYEKEYKAGNRASEFMEAYILKLKSASMNVQGLLDTYVGGLPVDSLTNFRIAKFIYTQGPAIDSRSYKAIRSVADSKLIDSIYKSIPYSQAVVMNNQIINASMQRAIQKRDLRLMYEVAEFTRNTYKNDWQRGQKAYSQNMLRYFYGVKDTLNYISTASRFFDTNYMLLSVDSLKRMDEQAMKARMKVRNEGEKPPMGLPNVITREMVPFSPPSQFYHIELNQGAWYFWELATKQNDLEKALMWSKRSMDLYEELNKDKHTPFTKGNPAYIDTYAHLLYKLNRKEEAIEWQTKALEAQKAAGQSYSVFGETLEKMKTGKL